MFRFLSKKELFQWAGEIPPMEQRGGLKDLQDIFMARHLRGAKGLKILEMGGGHSRVASFLARKNHVVNADKFEGNDGGPVGVKEDASVEIVETWLGEKSPDLPDASFDIVFSISVLEHIKDRQTLAGAIEDIDRILKPGGRTVHAVDVYLYDEGETSSWFRKANQEHCTLIRELFGTRFSLTGADRVPEAPSFRTWMVSNPDHAMIRWNKVAPSLKSEREIGQVATLCCEWRKPG